MDCRHVWSLADDRALVATCLRCRETRGLKELLAEAMDSADAGIGRTNADVEADFAELRAKISSGALDAITLKRIKKGLASKKTKVGPDDGIG